MKYILSIDQSTSGTKAFLFDDRGICRYQSAVQHKQIVHSNGWIDHDPEEIYRCVIDAVKSVITQASDTAPDILCVGISNQRETVMVWDRDTGKPLFHAIVWQCARAASICDETPLKENSALILATTGLPLSPYFSAAKLAWLFRRAPSPKRLLCGTIDSWLIYRLTGGKFHRTDPSNASRTQLFDIHNLCWSEELCELFGVPMESLPEVCPSDSLFGKTDFEGILPSPIGIHGVLGDSHAALLGQNCRTVGSVKATYGTGSSVVMHLGDRPMVSNCGLATSIAWARNNTVEYILEGNINYSGAVMQWICHDLGLLQSPQEASAIAMKANPEDETFLVPAFSGLGAPYWDSNAKAIFYGMARTTGRAELVKAAEDCIAHQITDVIEEMARASSLSIPFLKADGGAVNDPYLMQTQSDLLGTPVQIPTIRELSGAGAAFNAGIAVGAYDTTILDIPLQRQYLPMLSQSARQSKRDGWHHAIQRARS